jgi:threonine dehydratase
MIERIYEARHRLLPYIRHTPCVRHTPYRTPLAPNLSLKLENLQLSGSFKIRGAFNNLLQASPEQRERGVLVASGGNHGLAIAHAAHRLGLPATVILPQTAAPDRIARIRSWNATVILHGDNPSDTLLYAQNEAQERGCLYVHPFASEATLAGQGTVGLELLEDVPEIDCAVIAIGGGGLIAGTAVALRSKNPDIRIIGVEPAGAASMYQSLIAGGLTELRESRTIADTLSPRAVSELSLEVARDHIDEIVLVSDEQIVDAMEILWSEWNQLVEPAGAASIAAITSGLIDLSPYRAPVALICGGNAPVGPVFTAFRDKAAHNTDFPPIHHKLHR